MEEVHDEVAEHLADEPVEVQEEVAAVLVAAPAMGVAAAASLNRGRY